jgi:hypothetical protein
VQKPGNRLIKSRISPCCRPILMQHVNGLKANSRQTSNGDLRSEDGNFLCFNGTPFADLVADAEQVAEESLVVDSPLVPMSDTPLCRRWFGRVSGWRLGSTDVFRSRRTTGGCPMRPDLLGDPGKAARASVMDVTVRTAPIMDVIGRTGEHGRDARCTEDLGDPGPRRQPPKL